MMSLLKTRAISALAHHHADCGVGISGSDTPLRTTEANSWHELIKSIWTAAAGSFPEW
jgi:hypothetical protein